MTIRTAQLVGILQLVTALAFGVFAAPSVVDTYFADGAAGTEFSAMVTFVFLPIAAAFGVAAIALLRNWPRAWWYQALPVITLIAILVYLKSQGA